MEGRQWGGMNNVYWHGSVSGRGMGREGSGEV